jgi:hypothetical protein
VSLVDNVYSSLARDVSEHYYLTSQSLLRQCGLFAVLLRCYATHDVVPKRNDLIVAAPGPMTMSYPHTLLSTAQHMHRWPVRLSLGWTVAFCLQYALNSNSPSIHNGYPR